MGVFLCKFLEKEENKYMDENFKILLQAILDTTGINTDIEKVKKVVEKHTLNIHTELDKAELIKSVKALMPSIVKDLRKIPGVNIPVGIEYDEKLISKTVNQTLSDINKIASRVDKIKVDLDTEKLSTSVHKITQQIKSLSGLKLSADDGKLFTKAIESADKLKKKYEELQSAFGENYSSYTDDQRLKIEQQYQQELLKTKNLLSQVNSNKDNEIVHMGDEKRINMISTLNNYLSKNTAMSSKSRKEIEKWISKLASSDDMTVGAIRNINAEFKALDAQLRKTGQLGYSWTDKFKQTWEKFGGWSIATTSLMKLWHETKKGVQFIVELDDALTDVAYTSNVTSTQLKNLGDKSVGMAKDLNASATNVLEAVKIYSTANATADDILRKAKPAIMLSNVSGMSGADSAKMIQTSLNQFDLKDTEEGLLDITDTLQYVAGQLNYDFTEGMKEITEGIEASGSVAKNAGLNMQEYAAMVGVAIEQTGQSGSTIGQSYKTIFSRITRASSVEGTSTEDISKAETALRGIGVDVRSSNNEFRDMSDIMADIGKKWNSLTDVQRANVGYEVAGTRQLNILNSLFGSWEKYADIMADIDGRAGTTLENQNVYAESLRGYMEDISATTKSIWSNVFESDDFKNVLGTFNDLLGVIDKITGAIGTWGTLGAIGGVALNRKLGLQKRNTYHRQMVCEAQ